jgi:hypothetical protein
MKRCMPVVLLLVAVLVGAACGSDDATTVGATATTHAHDHGVAVADGSTTTASSVGTTAPETVSTVAGGKPHFDTPEAAMRYLARAWNADDQVSLRHVTNPSARDELDAMHDVAVNLTLKGCEERSWLGDYICTFSHDFPADASGHRRSGKGEAVFIAGPADTPGWYMTVFESCS